MSEKPYERPSEDRSIGGAGSRPEDLSARVSALESEVARTREEIDAICSAMSWRLANRYNSLRHAVPPLELAHRGLKRVIGLLPDPTGKSPSALVRRLGEARPPRTAILSYWSRLAALPPFELARVYVPADVRRAVKGRLMTLLAADGASEKAREADYLNTVANIKASCLRSSDEVRARYAGQVADLERRARDAKGVVIYLPTVRWGFLFQRPQQLMRQLARKGYLCLFCTPLPEDDEVDGLKEVEPNLLLCSDVRLLLKLANPIIWLNWPINRAYLPFFEGARVVYEFIDELDVFYLNCRHMEDDHQAIVAAADVVAGTADRLVERLRVQRPDAILAPNGVDPLDFDLPGHDEPVPADLAPILARGRPIVGYYGALAEWMDYDLLNRAAAEAPDLSFVLIGPDYDGSASRIVRRSNVFVLEPKQYKDLRHYSTRFDVATIPFQINEITRSTSPVKLFEYMAAGVPTVTTAMHECMKYSSVLIAHTADEYVPLLRKAATLGKDPGYRETLKREVLDNTWSKRVDDILVALDRRLASPSAA